MGTKGARYALDWIVGGDRMPVEADQPVVAHIAAPTRTCTLEMVKS